MYHIRDRRSGRCYIREYNANSKTGKHLGKCLIHSKDLYYRPVRIMSEMKKDIGKDIDKWKELLGISYLMPIKRSR